MRRTLYLVGILLGVLLLWAAIGRAQAPPALTEGQRLQAEVHALKGELLEARYQLATCQAQQQATTLTRERQQLEARFREALQPPAGAVFDWTTLTFTPPPPAASPERTP